MSSLAIQSNVTDFKRNEVSISMYLEEYLRSQRSKNTSKNYRADIVQFLNYVFDGKSIENITFEDIASLTSYHARMFKNSLVGKNATIKRKIVAVRGFLKALAVDYPNINYNIFNNIKLSDVNLDRNGYGNIEWDEAFLFIEYAHLKQMDGDQMAMLLKLSCISSLRLTSLLSLTWEDHFKVKNEKGVLVNYIDITDKETRHEVPISNDFYNELRESLGTSGKLFKSLYPHKVGRYIKQILEYFEVDPRRNIKFHSFKKCGVNRVLAKTGDLTKAQVQGKHKSIMTTNNNYIELKDDLTLKPSYTLDQDIDIASEIKDVPHDELVLAISQLSDSAKFD